MKTLDEFQSMWKMVMWILLLTVVFACALIFAFLICNHLRQGGFVCLCVMCVYLFVLKKKKGTDSNKFCECFVFFVFFPEHCGFSTFSCYIRE